MEPVGRVQVQAFLKEHTYKASQDPGHSHQVAVLTSVSTSVALKCDPCPSSKASELHTETAVKLGTKVGLPPFVGYYICDIGLCTPDSHSL